MGCNDIWFLILSAVFIQVEVSSAGQCCTGDPPSFTSSGQPPESVLVNLQASGNNLVLPCEVSGTHPITVSWFREGSLIRQIPLNSGADDSTLSIRVTEAEASREGTNYYCLASNRIGSENATVAALRSRNVNVSSSFFGGFQSREAGVPTVEGGDVALECAFNPSNPAPNITWFANNVMITETSRIQFLEGGRYLFIIALTAAEREMRYHCKVNNFRDDKGMPLTSPTTYTIDTDLEEETILVYKNQSTVFGIIGERVSLVFVAEAYDAFGILSLLVNCPRGNPFVQFGQLIGVTVPAVLQEAARNKSEVVVTCEIGSLKISGREEVVGTIIVSEFGLPPVNITTPEPDDPTLTDRERLVGGGPVEYPCEASGNPPPTITWYYNGAVVQSGSGGVVVGGDGTLTISAPQVSHSGIYQCFARNQFSDDSRAWILEVRGPVIQIIDCESDFPIVEHNQNNILLPPLDTTNLVITVTVETTFVGVPSRDDFCPNVQWQINGTDIVNDTVYAVSNSCGIRENERIHLFTLTIATFTLDTIGEYSMSSQDAGVSKQLAVTFQECSKSGPDKPVSDGSRVDIRCSCRDIIPANVSWFKDGRSLDNDRIQTLQFMNNVFVLSIEPVRIMDAGRYTCTITTGAGQYSGNITVDLENHFLENNGGTTIIGGAFTNVVLVFIGVKISVVVVFKVV